MTTGTFDVNKVRQDFPLLNQQVNGNPLVYLDNGATSQKPQSVIDAIVSYYTTTNSNVHRGVHTMSQQATDHYEGARTKIRRFINAGEDHEIIFTRNTTEGMAASCINLRSPIGSFPNYTITDIPISRPSFIPE